MEGVLIRRGYIDVVRLRVGDREFNITTMEELEKLCKKLREELSQQCLYHSWYIRTPPDRLLALLKKAYVKYTQGVVSVGEVITEFLDEYKLSKSISRTITPTLSALGLTAGGKFTSAAVELGKLLYEGRWEEARDKLLQLALKNCVLRDIFDKVEDCRDLEKAVATVLTDYGKGLRPDELKYTTELVKLLYPKCQECDFKCATADKVAACLDAILQTAKPHLRELFEKLDISLLPEHLDFFSLAEGEYAVGVRGTAKQIGIALVGKPLENAALAQLKDALVKLDEKVQEGVYDVYIKIQPVLEGANHCKVLKLLLEVVRGDLERVSKYVKISP
ncbi:MAG: hypothetical protein ABWK05_02755 [Pyrobaculum sp.]